MNLGEGEEEEAAERRMSATSSGSSAAASRERRQIKPNSHYPQQPGVKKTNDQRNSQTPSKSPKTPTTSTRGSKSSVTSPAPLPASPIPSMEDGEKGENAELRRKISLLEKRLAETEGLKKRLIDVEGKLEALALEGKESSEEIRRLRDRLEEGEWAQKRLEEKIAESEVRQSEVEKLRKEVEKERKDRSDWEAAMAEEKRVWRKEADEMEKRLESKVATTRSSGNLDQQSVTESRVSAHPRRKCIVITDSNGRGASEDSIKTHIPRENRGSLDIMVRVAYTLEDACRQLRRGEIDAAGAMVVVDNLTNDVRGTWNRPAASPMELVQRVERLRAGLAGTAASVVICEIKPMQQKDVRPYNLLLHEYLCAQGLAVSGCRTQIRVDNLRHDGFHIRPEFVSVIDRQYACAILNMPVPCPTPFENFVPEFVKRQYDREWPALAGGGNPRDRTPNHGWSW